MINFPLRSIELECVDSTNLYAKNLIRNGEIHHGTLISARCQTSGRGRLSRAWHSEADKSLTLSAVIETPLIPAVTLLCGIALKRALTDCTGCSDFSLKWPNDVLLKNKKVAGILVERSNEFTIIGIGVNVNNLLFPKEIEHKATSLKILFGRDFDTNILSQHIADALMNVFTQYNYYFGDKAKAEYSDLCINLGKEVRFGENLSQQGITTGIAADGSLIVRSGDEERLISTGEVFVSGIY